MCNDNDLLSAECVAELLGDVVTEEGIEEAVFEISKGTVKGDGFVSDMVKVVVKGANKEMQVIIKRAPTNHIIRNPLPTRAMYLREIKYYKEVLPAFEKLQIERNAEELFKSSPVCYKTCDLDGGELIVLEDLRVNGFKLFPKKEQMNEAHIALVLDAYAHLHALSFAMKEHDPNSFKDLSENMDYLLTFQNMGLIINVLLDGADMIKNAFDESTEPEMYDYFKNLKETASAFITSLENYDGKDGVFIHGDSWCNNMLFKYEDKDFTSPSDVRLLDLQLCALMPPALDVIYFFYVSASPEMMDNYQHYLKLYHDKLRKYMDGMDCCVDKYYAFSVLQEDWKKYAQIGLYFCTPIFRVRFQGDDEIIDFSEASPQDVLMKSSRFEDLIQQKYKEVAMHFYKYKLL